MRIKIKTDGTCNGTTVINAETGEDISRNVQSIDIKLDAREYGKGFFNPVAHVGMVFYSGESNGYELEGDVEATVSEPKEAA